MRKLFKNVRRPLRDVKSQKTLHLADHLLIRAIDGELSAREMALVDDHLEACWSCRARHDRIEESIADVVDYRNLLLKPYLPPPDSSRTIFAARLDQYATKFGQPSVWHRVIGAFHSATTLAWRAESITALLIVGFVIFFFIKMRSVPPVSASELLEKAQVSEAQALHTVARPVLYQKLRVRTDGYSLTRSIYRDPVGNREAESDATFSRSQNAPAQGQDVALKRTPAELEAELQRAFRAVHLE